MRGPNLIRFRSVSDSHIHITIQYVSACNESAIQRNRNIYLYSQRSHCQRNHTCARAAPSTTRSQRHTCIGGCWPNRVVRLSARPGFRIPRDEERTATLGSKMSSDDDIIDWGDLECTVGASEWCGKECDPVTAAGICPEHVSTQIIAGSFVK